MNYSNFLCYLVGRVDGGETMIEDYVAKGDNNE